MLDLSDHSWLTIKLSIEAIRNEAMKMDRNLTYVPYSPKDEIVSGMLKLAEELRVANERL